VDSDRRHSGTRVMFGRIARRYNLLNRLMTFGQDRVWRREAVRRLRVPPDARLLDVGAGTGDLSAEALRHTKGTRVVAVDFSPEMITIGQRRLKGGRIQWLAADASHLPLRDASFEGVISGFLLRNVADVDRVLREQHRLLAPGGRVVCLDTTAPGGGLLAPLLRFHRRKIIPLLGLTIARDEPAYHYLADSTEAFLTGEALADLMMAAGFRHVGFARRALGSVAIHWGTKGPVNEATPNPSP